MKKAILLSLILTKLCLINAQGVWTNKSVPSIGNRLGAFSCSIGTKGYMGGGEYNTGGGYFTDWWEYDPTTNVWTQKANYTTTGNGRTRGTSFSIGTSGYIVCGKAAGTTVFNETRRYNSGTNSWTTVASYPGNGRWGMTSFTIGNSGYVGTGTSNGSSYHGDIWEFNGSTWVSRAGVPSRRDAVSFTINGKGYLGCGKDLSGTGSCSDRQDFLEYDPITNTWINKANFPVIMSWGIGFNLGSFGYMGSGVGSGCSSLGGILYRYDPINNSWTSISGASAGHGGYCFTINNKAYVGGGGANVFQEYNPCGNISFTLTNTNVTCNGNDNGVITINANGGTTPYQYSIDNGISFQSTNSFTNLTPNTYSLIITDANSCTTSSQNATITEPDEITFFTTQENINCFGANTGSIFVSANGGSGILQYSKDNGMTWQSSSIFSNLIAGVYDVKVKDVNNCITSSQTVTITQPTILSFTTSQTNMPCNGENTGSITISATGGTTPYQYSINNGSFYQSSNAFTNLSEGNNTVIVKDINNCVTSTQVVTITQPSTISVSVNSVNLSCNESNDGTITISSTGGTLPHQYSINGGTNYQSSNVFSNLLPTTYNIIVQDINNCLSSSQNITITEPSLLSFSATQSNISCNGSNNGSITVTASGGTTPYQYSSDNGQSFQSANTFSNLSDNTYIVLIKDANNCTSNSQSFNITEPSEVSFTSTQNNVVCNGGSNGSITVTALGGTGIFQYSKDDGSTFQTSNTFVNLVAGTYVIKVKDDNNCISNPQSVIITEPVTIPQPTITASGPLDFCIGDSVVLTSSTSDSYNWSTSATTQSITIYNSSTITVSIFDNTGCSSTSNPISVNAFSLPPIPTITASGNTLTSSSATGNQWYLNETIITGATNQSYIATENGNYSVEVTNSNNCKSISEQFNYGLTEINENYFNTNISVYPNPSSGLVYLDIDGTSITEIKVLNLMGKIIYKSDEKVSSIDLFEKPKGIYLLLLTYNGQSFTKKIIIQ